ncbi:MFS transporter [Shewanella sp. GXUN23E]|uniref:MFS transporter n=1 Tax=Shewanella sp. GXUN23E TaxID=3422498 RepID=UPI003D7D1614
MSRWQTPFGFLAIAVIIMTLNFSAWNAMLNNFAIEVAQFDGAQIGLLQSLREIPGFLAFTAVFVLLILKEQTFALLSLCLLSVGVAITGLLPSMYGLFATTVLMSIGFHYFETLNQSLSLQWFSKAEAPAMLGKLMSLKSLSALLAFGMVWLGFTLFDISYRTMYLLAGGCGLLLCLLLAVSMPQFPERTPQRRKLLLRKRYRLYYLLTFLSGARRQIFVVFAGFLMVEKFGYSVTDITALYMLNHLINFFLAPIIGRWIGRVGEQRALTLEYTGLIMVFVGYGLVESGYLAAALYVVDHLFFAMAIGIKTYFQKIANAGDIAATSGVSFTINHIAAVIIPASFGILWLINPSRVFYLGALLALASLIASQWINRDLAKGPLELSAAH